jgi:hypothetical protein
MTTTTNRFPAGIHEDSVIITPAGRAALNQALSRPVRYEWDILALDLAADVRAPLIAGAEIVDSYTCLTAACLAATHLNRLERARGGRTLYLVQRHPDEEPPAQIEF